MKLIKRSRCLYRQSFVGANDRPIAFNQVGLVFYTDERSHLMNVLSFTKGSTKYTVSRRTEIYSLPYLFLAELT